MTRIISYLLITLITYQPVVADDRVYEALMLSAERAINSSSELNRENQIQMLQDVAKSLTDLLKAPDFKSQRAEKALEAISERLQILKGK